MPRPALATVKRSPCHAWSLASIGRIELDHTYKQVIRVAGVRTQMRFDERSRRAVDAKQSILPNFDCGMVLYLD